MFELFISLLLFIVSVYKKDHHIVFSWWQPSFKTGWEDERFTCTEKNILSKSQTYLDLFLTKYSRKGVFTFFLEVYTNYLLTTLYINFYWTIRIIVLRYTVRTAQCRFYKFRRVIFYLRVGTESLRWSTLDGSLS